MKHEIDASQGPRLPEMTQAIENCVHCGLCLADCPTYQVLGEEMDSPRGRIYLMKNVLEETLQAEDAQPYIDRCLGCMACVTSCPSGVGYGDLLLGYRAKVEADRKRPVMDAVTRSMIVETLPYPQRFRAAAQAGKLGMAIRPLLPDSVGQMLDMLPEALPKAQPIPAVNPVIGERRGRVALIVGCVQDVLAPEINRGAVEVLTQNGIEVVVPEGQGCCGSILLHVGEDERAQRLAKNNFSSFPDDVDAYITTAAGCGSGIHDYGLVFSGLPEEEAARAFSKRTMDFTTYLAQVGMVNPPSLSQPVKIAYQDACHHLHAQGIKDEPRSLLEQINGVTILPVNDAGLCCGSAGTYNIEQPEIAHQLGQQKANNLLATGGDVIVSGNIGCINQVRTHLQLLGSDTRVMHIAQFIASAYRLN